MSLSELDRRFRRAVGRSISTESDRQFILDTLKQNITLRGQELAEFQKELADIGPMKMGPSMEAEADDLEKVFNRLGIEFGNQAVLTDKEARAAAERQGDGLGSASDLPPLVFDLPHGEKPPNPIGMAFQTAARSV